MEDESTDEVVESIREMNVLRRVCVSRNAAGPNGLMRELIPNSGEFIEGSEVFLAAGVDAEFLTHYSHPLSVTRASHHANLARPLPSTPVLGGEECPACIDNAVCTGELFPMPLVDLNPIVLVEDAPQTPPLILSEGEVALTDLPKDLGDLIAHGAKGHVATSLASNDASSCMEPIIELEACTVEESERLDEDVRKFPVLVLP